MAEPGDRLNDYLEYRAVKNQAELAKSDLKAHKLYVVSTKDYSPNIRSRYANVKLIPHPATDASRAQAAKEFVESLQRQGQQAALLRSVQSAARMLTVSEVHKQVFGLSDVKPDKPKSFRFPHNPGVDTTQVEEALISYGLVKAELGEQPSFTILSDEGSPGALEKAITHPGVWIVVATSPKLRQQVLTDKLGLDDRNIAVVIGPSPTDTHGFAAAVLDGIDYLNYKHLNPGRANGSIDEIVAALAANQ